MYERFYGLRELPFELTPDPRYLYLTPRHREALSNLQYGLGKRRSVTLLVGEAGTGKTTLVRALLEREPFRRASIAYVNNPSLTRSEFVELLAHAFDLGDRASRSKTALLFELERALRERSARGMLTALVVDEAQTMPIELLEEVRLLANIETPTEKLLPVVLAGQPQLAARLNEPALCQLKQRVALRCELRPLDLRETCAYIAGRLRIAGGDGSLLFTREAVELVHRCSGGIPRTISVICDNALVTGFAANQRPIGADIVRGVCADFDFAPAGAAPHRAGAATEARDHVAQPAGGDGSMFRLFARRRRFSFF